MAALAGGAHPPAGPNQVHTALCMHQHFNPRPSPGGPMAAQIMEAFNQQGRPRDPQPANWQLPDWVRARTNSVHGPGDCNR